MEEKYITIAEAAKLIGLSTARIYQLIEKYGLKVQYRRGIKICLESEILKLDEPEKNLND